MRLQPLLLGSFLVAASLTACGDDDVDSTEGDGGLDGGAGSGAGTGGRGGSGGRGGQSGLSCGEGTSEVDGECVPDGGAAAPVRLPIGSACESDSECANGLCQVSPMLPGNYCTVSPCSADNPCPVGSTCYLSTTGIRLCMAFCEGDVDCREGYGCQPLYTNGISICAPPCTVTGVCASGTRCNDDNGLCELAECDPAAEESSCEDSETCYPDRRGLGDTGGLCMRLCDPDDASATCLGAGKEVCQPLPENPAETGFCAPPVCSASHECPAGAICANDVCQPPALCDDETACAEGLVCVSGKCMSACPTDDTTCADIHPGLVCADVLAEPACLPVGTFPGGACRPNRDDACSAIGGGTIPMVCENDVCLVDCTTGGNALCEGVSSTLTCATGIFETPLCLPKGAFPGGPCGASDTCAQDLEGNPDVDMVCRSGTCVVDCDEGDHWDGWGDAMCSLVDSTLTCSESAGDVCVRACVAGDCADGYSCLDPGDVPDNQNACLPSGSFPGSECGASDFCADDLSGNAAVDQRCVNGTCVVECTGDVEAICDGVSPALTCSESAGEVCVVQCAAGACLPGFSCLNPTGENACLPNGTFPGSACGASDFCADDLGGNTAVDQRCVGGTCVVECTGDVEAICDGVSASLTCSESAGEVCVVQCAAGACLPGFSCLEPGGENACLPNGTFPGSACGASEFCADNLGGNDAVDQSCVDGTCVVECPGDTEAICDGVSASLTCSESAGNICVIGCAAGACLPGFSCLDPGGENACLPTGSFPGSPCRATVGDECDQNVGGNADADMACIAGRCVVPCPGDDDELCGEVSDVLTCSESAGNLCVPACALGVCGAGFSCLNPTGENACLPNGSFPGSACGASDFCADNLGGVADRDQRCVDGTCVVECPGDTEAICTGVSAALTCSESAGDLCVPSCATSACPTGYSCLTFNDEDACLPTGSFPSSPCRETVGDECDQNLLDDPDFDMECTAADLCAVRCDGNDDAHCQEFNAGWTCATAAGDVCVVACGPGDLCPPGFTCFVPEDSCFPTL